MDAEKTTSPVATHRFVVPAEHSGKRLDLVLAERVPELSRRRARVLISAGAVSVDARRVLVRSRPVRAGQEVVYHLQSFRFPRPQAVEPLPILHEDAALLALDKPSGMPSHPTFARALGTALQVAETMLRGRNAGAKVPLWPLHRLDSATSGVLLFAKTQAAARAVNRSFARRRVAKRYLALVAGVPSPALGEIRLPLAERHLRAEPSALGKEALSRYRVLEALGDAALVELQPTTGRMHQLRVHLAAIGHPVLGDAKYGDGAPAGPTPASRLMLHASRLELPHPIGGAPLTIESPPPADFAAEVARHRQRPGGSPAS
ncbi:MAG: RluA family pseudouridine synthase [Deltaproteobacteria bacterium]|nr:RluA family pseudouridine synthase [Deltaproteobacteria bacterium]